MQYRILNYKYREKNREKLLRYKFKNNEFYYILLKIIKKNKYINIQQKILVIFYLIILLENNTLTKQKNICLISGYRRSVNILTKLNRLTLQEQLGSLEFPGFTVAKW
uniref:Ribosomal protein S14 n=1 Tax=Gruberia lanceolata TaxID=1978530 RepID=A0A6C0UBX1_9CILI|nr:ribosomal protein S14 [Gruberia lanceolata]